MIKKDNKTIKKIYKGSSIIDKIYKGTILIYELWNKLVKQGIPPLTLTKCKENNLLNYQVYGNSIQGDLPEGYTQLEYIESTGKQYIDTGFIPNQDTEVTMDFQLTSSATGGYPLFGVRVSKDSNGFTFQKISNEYWGGMYGDTLVNGNTKQFDTNRHIVNKNKNIVYLDGTTLMSFDSQIFTCTGNMYLFAMLNNGVVFIATQPIRVFSFKIYDDNTLVRNMVPCINYQNEIGMYDTITNTFYTNQGTESFVAGTEMPNPDNPIEIQSVGDKTANLWETNGTNYGWITTTGVLSTAQGVSRRILVEQNKTYYYTSYRESGGFYNCIAEYDENMNFITHTRKIITTGSQKQNSVTITNPNTKYLICAYYTISPYNVPEWNMITQDDSTTDFIPYGYKIPVRVGTEILPKGYIQLDYIESTGTQYIDTGYNANQNIEVRVKASDDGLASMTSIVGILETNTNSSLSLFLPSSIGTTSIARFDGKSITMRDFLDGEFIINKNGLYRNGVLYNSFGEINNFTSTDTMYLFKVRNNSQYLDGKIYYCKIYDNGVLVRNFVPCKNSIGIVGLYDTVNDMFYTNAGTGDFVAGNEVSTITNIYLTEPLRKIGNADAVKLPNGYRQLEYIETTGTQYINFGTLNIDTYKTKLEYVGQLLSGTVNQRVFAHGTVASKTNFTAWERSDGYYMSIFGIESLFISNTVSEKHKVVMERTSPTTATFSVNDTLLGTASGTFVPSDTYNAYFCGSPSAVSDNRYHGRLWYLKLWQNNVLIKNLIPAKNSTGEIGLYDTVNDMFYTNAGTGTFIAGPEIYADYIDFENQKVIRRVYEYEITGNESGWYDRDLDYNVYGIVFRNDSLVSYNTNVTNALCNYFLYGNIATQRGIFSKAIGSKDWQFNITDGQLNISKDEVASIRLSKWKEWLQECYNNGNPVKLNYILENQTEENITLPDILLNKGTNIVDVETSLAPSNIEVKYLSKSKI